MVTILELDQWSLDLARQGEAVFLDFGDI
jgi:hypothetical protein